MRRSWAPSNRSNPQGQGNNPANSTIHVPQIDIISGAPVGEQQTPLNPNYDPSLSKTDSPNSAVQLVATRLIQKHNDLNQQSVAAKLVMSNDYAEEPETLAANCPSLFEQDIVSDKESAASTVPQAAAASTVPQSQTYWSVLYGKTSSRKHKVWEADGILVCSGRTAALYDQDGVMLAKGGSFRVVELLELECGSRLVLSGKEVEMQNPLAADDDCLAAIRSSSAQAFAPSLRDKSPVRPKQAANKMKTNSAASLTGRLPMNMPQYVPAPKRFANPLRDLNCDRKRMKLQPGQPLHDVLGENALVMTEPDITHQDTFNTHLLPLTPVVVDPHLSRHLRAHQREGVSFLYDAVTGIRQTDQFGCILADEMGLGKSLQCITLVWTVLKQSSYGLRPLVKRVLLVCPCSLVQNWVAEFAKWLGNERLKVFALGKSDDVRAFEYSTHVNPVCIVGYELAAKVHEKLMQLNFDLLICDEAHRLKNQSVKSTKCLQQLNIERRVLLTGTPVQNDLQELYSLCSFANPGCLATAGAFRREFDEPITSGQTTDADWQLRMHGDDRLKQLMQLVGGFMLRRTAQLNHKYLPPKVLQRELYESVLQASAVRSIGNDRFGAQHLVAIDALRKLCNHPSILAYAAHEKATKDQDNYSSLLYTELSESIGAKCAQVDCAADDSGKLSFLCDLLERLANQQPREKIVIVSNYTLTLSLIENYCASVGYASLCLTGATAQTKRLQLVNQFNSPDDPTFVFLLSSKAGGCGLNLIGANRIVLFDVDWNPANDQQALARVWRDGQTKRCHIYRMVTTGTIEEKILQRQMKKQGLSSSVIDAQHENANSEAQGQADAGTVGGKITFSKSDLRDLFTLHSDTDCQTHVLSGCECAKDGCSTTGTATEDKDNQQTKVLQRGPVSMSTFNRWRHLDRQHLTNPCTDAHTTDGDWSDLHLNDACLLAAIRGNAHCSFLLHHAHNSEATHTG